MTAADERRRVAYLTNLYPAASHTFIRREIAALEAAGWQVHRYAHRRARDAPVDPADLAEERRTQVLREAPVREIAGALLRRPGRTLAAIAMALRLAWRGDGRVVAHLGQCVLAAVLVGRLERLGSPHLHVHFGTHPATVALLAQRLAGTSYSITCHGPHEYEQPDRLNLARKMAGARFVVAVSQAGAALLRQRHPAQAHKVVHVHCGLDNAWWSQRPPPMPAATHLACIARLDAQKDPLLLVDAAARVVAQGQPMTLSIAGDGPLRAAVAQRIAQHGLGGRVLLLGWRTGAQVAALLADARALVLSSRDEGLPVAVMEAFASGRPAIAPDVGGVRELVETGVTGWLVPPGNVEALANAMLDALRAAPARLDRLGQAARERVAPYRAAASAAQLAELFLATAGPAPPGTA